MQPLFYTTPVSGTPGKIERDIHYLQHRINWMIDEAIIQHEQPDKDLKTWESPDHIELIIVDEADRPNRQALNNSEIFMTDWVSV